MSVIVRFAPSPTGYLHIGGARTALFNYLFSKHHCGKFLLRIEDTDAQRSTNSAISAITEGLDWLGLKHDDEIVMQSQNIARHVEVAQELLNKNQAYYCYTSSQELDEMRHNAEKKGEVFRFQSPWRNQFNSQNSTLKPVIRLKSPLDGETQIDDLVQGKINVKNCEIDDLVLLRSDNTPTYMLAVVVDDHDMKISHIIRGDDHLTNAFRQKIIYQALNWKVPEFAHIPLIHGSDGAKLSKRHGATSVIEYKQLGYLPQAMRNYLLRLGWSHGDEEIISDEQAIEWFNLDKVGKSPSRFDFAKLNHLNHHYLKQKTNKDLSILVFDFLEKKPNQEEENRLILALNFLKEKSDLITQIADNCKIYFNDFRQEFNEQDLKILQEKKSLLQNLLSIFNKIDNWNSENIKKNIDEFAKENSLKIKDFAPILRLALTFSSASSGGIFEIVEILGKDEIINRLNNALK
jgi:glutamyl-tRNA synthetase